MPATCPSPALTSPQVTSCHWAGLWRQTPLPLPTSCRHPHGNPTPWTRFLSPGPQAFFPTAYRDTLPATHGTLASGPCFCPHRQPPSPRGISGISATLGPPIHRPLPGLAVFPEWPPPSPRPALLPSHADTLPPPWPHPSKWATPRNRVDKFHCNSYFPTSNCHSAMAHGLVSPAGLPPAPRQCHSSSQTCPTGHGLVLSWQPA